MCTYTYIYIYGQQYYTHVCTCTYIHMCTHTYIYIYGRQYYNHRCRKSPPSLCSFAIPFSLAFWHIWHCSFTAHRLMHPLMSHMNEYASCHICISHMNLIYERVGTINTPQLPYLVTTNRLMHPLIRLPRHIICHLAPLLPWSAVLYSCMYVYTHTYICVHIHTYTYIYIHTLSRSLNTGGRARHGRQ